MKAVPKVNKDGLYIEDALVDDAFSGVVPFYAPLPVPEPTESGEPPEQPEDDEDPEREIAGYIVGVPVVPGLYLPRFDLAAWEAREEATPVNPADFWHEGLTPEEIEDLHKPAEPSELDRIGAELVARELEALEFRQQNEVLGEQIVQRELEAADLKAQNEALGGQIVGLELHVLTLENAKTEGDVA